VIKLKKKKESIIGKGPLTSTLELLGLKLKKKNDLNE
jgi:hypothetical protein